MQTRPRWQSLALGLGVAASLAGAAPALAASHTTASPAAASRVAPVTSGTITLNLTEQTTKILGREGAVGVELTDPGALPVDILVGEPIALPIGSGSIEPRTGEGVLKSSRSVSLLGRDRDDLTIDGFTFDTRNGLVTSLGQKIATLSGGTVTRDGSVTTVSGVELKATRAFAEELDEFVGGQAFVPGQALATASIVTTVAR